MKISRIRQSITGLGITAAIVITLVCGIVVALAEGQTSAGQRATPTVFHIPTLIASGRATPSATPRRNPTVVLIPTNTRAAPSATHKATLAATASTATFTSGTCQIVTGWTSYRVQPGDTLFLIGLRYGLTVTSIMHANCLQQTIIHNGDVLFVPPVTPRPLPNSTLESSWLTDPAPTGTQTATDGACSNPDSVITSPKVGAVLSGTVRIVGTARVPDFAFYKIEIRQEGSSTPYANLFTGDKQVVKNTLADLDTSVFPKGEYWLRLVVVDARSNYPERCAILVTLTH